MFVLALMGGCGGGHAQREATRSQQAVASPTAATSASPAPTPSPPTRLLPTDVSVGSRAASLKDALKLLKRPADQAVILAPSGEPIATAIFGQDDGSVSLRDFLHVRGFAALSSEMGEARMLRIAPRSYPFVVWLFRVDDHILAVMSDELVSDGAVELFFRTCIRAIEAILRQPTPTGGG